MNTFSSSVTPMARKPSTWRGRAFLSKVSPNQLIGENLALSLRSRIRELVDHAMLSLLLVVLRELGICNTMSWLNSLSRMQLTAPMITRTTVAWVAGKRTSTTTLTGILSWLRQIILTWVKILSVLGNLQVSSMLSRLTLFPTVMLISLRPPSLNSLLLWPLMLVTVFSNHTLAVLSLRVVEISLTMLFLPLVMAPRTVKNTSW